LQRRAARPSCGATTLEGASMQHDIHSRLVAGTIAGLLAIATTAASAAGPRQQAAPDGAHLDFTKVLGKQLVSTSVEGDTVHYTLNPGFTSIGVPIVFKCAAACTVMVQTMVQVEQLSPYWAICPLIDNVDAIQGCNWQGVQSTSTSTYVTGNGTYFWSLAAGKHTFQAQVYFSVVGGLDNWAVTIAEYQ
jgi:hypothetical protein